MKSFKLRNEIMNDLILNNDTTKFYLDQIILTDPFILTYTGQNFFIHPKYQGQTFKVDPRSNLTIKDAVIFQPQNLYQNKMEMKLLIKNNYTLL